MAARENPDRYVFIRDGKEAGRSESPKALATWADRLVGKLFQRYVRSLGLTAATERVAEFRRRKALSQEGLKPGITRGGKPLGTGTADPNNRP